METILHIPSKSNCTSSCFFLLFFLTKGNTQKHKGTHRKRMHEIQKSLPQSLRLPNHAPRFIALFKTQQFIAYGIIHLRTICTLEQKPKNNRPLSQCINTRRGSWVDSKSASSSLIIGPPHEQHTSGFSVITDRR